MATCVHTVTFPVIGEAPPTFWVPRLADGTIAPPALLDPRDPLLGPFDASEWPRVVENLSIRAPARPSPA